MTLTAHFDQRFSEPNGSAPPWSEVSALLASAELYWITTVRTDGSPHVTPLVGLWHQESFVFCTGPSEQKARNLESNATVAVATGTNTWNVGHDVVVEGTAERVIDTAALRTLADAYLEKYGEDWAFDPSEGGFGEGEQFAIVFTVAPSKVLSFTKGPHGQTRYTR
ncbi:pyridoxamine 5'-phosphate oxidase family protein [Mycobacterium sp. CBMA271]|uniref:pyridoxamine 5'-phosphate oxidase family protein n=1 Tax=unclassified Mycobacteroides TaxID=2618759 RepID=UPI0012DD55A1|nr:MULTISPECIES: pyridoxamine 5'-phosphate oxidase family protein [unclassified Mycobacteroides]MUM19861.1 pyridoxamine 5-phosphate oxidase [Mycobacteroides sp. CBMA 326]MUM20981.1 pyridoxamine 5'-phosphate oxidase family protein [Mycobacteroides sp. CBMA 271]